MATADGIEIAWTALAVGGLFYALYCLWDYIKVRSELLLFGINGDVLAQVGETIRRESIRSIIQFLMSLAGVIAMSLPPAVAQRNIGRLVIISSLMLMSFLHVLNTHLDRRSVLRRRKRGDHAQSFDVLDRNTLKRIEQIGIDAAKGAAKVALDLAKAQGRADIASADPGSAADAASKTAPTDNP